MMENAPKHFPYQSPPEYKWKKKKLGGIFILPDKGVLRLYGGQIQKTMKYWGKYDYTSSGWASRAAQIRMVCSA